MTGVRSDSSAVCRARSSKNTRLRRCAAPKSSRYLSVTSSSVISARLHMVSSLYVCWPCLCYASVSYAWWTLLFFHTVSYVPLSDVLCQFLFVLLVPAKWLVRNSGVGKTISEMTYNKYVRAINMSIYNSVTTWA